MRPPGRVAALALCVLPCGCWNRASDDAAEGVDGGATTDVNDTWGDGPAAPETGTETETTDDNAEGAGTTWTPTDCDVYEGAATPDQVDATPRENEEAEILAMEASGEVVAPEDLYQRVLEEIAALRSAYPMMADLTASPSWWPSSLYVRFDGEGQAQLDSDSYIAWDCPNELYRVQQIDESASIPGAWLTFEGRYNIPLLEEEYLLLEHIIYTERNYPFGGAATDVCLELDGDRHFYLFEQGSGDCPSGCIHHTYWGFSVDPGEEATYLGTFDRGDAEPAWFMELSRCGY